MLKLQAMMKSCVQVMIIQMASIILDMKAILGATVIPTRKISFQRKNPSRNQILAIRMKILMRLTMIQRNWMLVMCNSSMVLCLCIFFHRWFFENEDMLDFMGELSISVANLNHSTISLTKLYNIILILVVGYFKW